MIPRRRFILQLSTKNRDVTRQHFADSFRDYSIQLVIKMKTPGVIS
uniref:Uncharacterized protein n=1 Tax=Anguilla anguilla TaxID=7936 RepID=A0A0E9WND5_ANGAN